MFIFIRAFHATVFTLVAMILFVQTAAASELNPIEGGTTGTPYTWASKRIEGAIWGIAQGDVNGDGRAEVILLERSRVRVGHFEGKDFKQEFTCDWKGLAKAAKIHLYDLDEDGRDDAVITAIEDGLPASLALKIGEKGCEQIVSRARWSLRAIDVPAEDGISPAKRKLIGQGWSSQQYFTGPIYEMEFKSGKLKKGAKLKLPRRTQLYGFSFMPSIDDSPAVALLRGISRLEIRQHVKRNKWNRIWRSGQKFGGSANYLHANQRPALDEKTSDVASFDMPPLALMRPGGTHLVVPHYNISLKGMIGKNIHVKESQVVEYRPDPALTFIEQMRTQKLPGYAVDYVIDDSGMSGQKRLLLLLQTNISAFESPLQAIVLKYDL